MKKLTILICSLLWVSTAWAGPRVNLIEKLEADLKQDKALSAQERQTYLDEFKQQLGAYAFDIMKGNRTRGAEVILEIMMVGSFDQLPVKRIVSVATGAYVAISRGGHPEVVHGIALYGFKKKLKADMIAALANGYRECRKAGIPRHVAKDLIYHAADGNWDIETFNRLKRGLILAAKEKLNVEDFNAYMLGNFKKGGVGPGRMVAKTLRVFRKAAQTKTRPKMPKYQSPCAPPPQLKKLRSEKKKKKKPPKVTPKTPGTPPPPPPPPPKEKVSKKGFFSKMDGSIGSFLGTPYVWGGRTRRGTDCSGFTQSVFAELGVYLPRNSRRQWKVGRSVKYKQLRKGDLVFFRTIGNRISHVGIFTKPAKNEFVHASSSRGVVRSNLESKYYKKRYAGARRVIPEWFTSVIW
jgi:cell wall-associated NlpC family hydrolase